MIPKRVLFLTLYTYSLTGGIEKVCRIFNEVLAQINIKSYLNLAMYDKAPAKNMNHQTFAGNRISFGYQAIKNGLNHDVIILSHINLLLFAKIIRRFNPNKRIILFTHGIEVWNKLPTWKTKLLQQIEIWPVSQYTAKQIEKNHGVKASNLRVLNNCLESDFNYISIKEKPNSLIKKYKLATDKKIILTVCRLSSAEQYKGYDLVLLALKDLVKIQPELKYFIVGGGDLIEKSRIVNLIERYNLQNHVILTGYVEDVELYDFYQLADVFAMPSKAEGFGIVFLEALANGCRVLAGNTDGSTDALLNGDLGTLVDPEDVEEIYQTLLRLINTPITQIEITKQTEKLKTNFSFEAYKRKVEALLSPAVMLRNEASPAN